MINVINQILATEQRRYSHVASKLEAIRDQGLYHFVLELTERQAELLGWKPQSKHLDCQAFACFRLFDDELGL